MESWLWNHGCGILAVESLLWNPGCGILAVNPGGGIVLVESRLWNPGWGILVVESLLWLFEALWQLSWALWELWEAGCLRLSGSSPGLSGSSGRLWGLEAAWEAKKLIFYCVLQCSRPRPTIPCESGAPDIHFDCKFTAFQRGRDRRAEPEHTSPALENP